MTEARTAPRLGSRSRDISSASWATIAQIGAKPIAVRPPRPNSTGWMAEARDRHTAILLSDGRVLIAGGQGGYGSGYTCSASAELYPDTMGDWSVVTTSAGHSDGGPGMGRGLRWCPRGLGAELAPAALLPIAGDIESDVGSRAGSAGPFESDVTARSQGDIEAVGLGMSGRGVEGRGDRGSDDLR